MVKGTCSLCNNDAELVLSHIIPKFVFKSLKASGRLRSNQSPNKRIQDGKKLPLLCSNCEELFSGWEKRAYEDVFLPLSDNSRLRTQIRYGSWALKFAVSVSWRVLLYSSQFGLPHLSEKQRERAREALETWRRFLLGELPHPGRFEQHLLPLDLIETCNGFTPSPFINRYIMLTSHMEVVYSKSSVTICTKLGRIFLFGFVQEYISGRWKGTKLHVRSGSIILPRKYVIPTEILMYMNDRANEAANVLASISAKQGEIIEDTIIQNADEIIDSDIFRAMQYDIRHSGKEAFKVTEARNRANYLSDEVNK